MPELLRQGTRVVATVRQLVPGGPTSGVVEATVSEVPRTGDRVRVRFPAMNGPQPPEDVYVWVDRTDVERI